MITIFSISLTLLGLGAAILFAISWFEQGRRIVEISRSLILMVLVVFLMSLGMNYLDLSQINKQIKEQNFELVKKIRQIEEKNVQLETAKADLENENKSLAKERQEIREIKLKRSECLELQERVAKIEKFLGEIGVDSHDIESQPKLAQQIE